MITALPSTASVITLDSSDEDATAKQEHPEKQPTPPDSAPDSDFVVFALTIVQGDYDTHYSNFRSVLTLTLTLSLYLAL